MDIEPEFVDLNTGRDHRPVPADIELVIRSENALIEHLERRFEQRRPRALKNHGAFLREVCGDVALIWPARQRQAEGGTRPGRDACRDGISCKPRRNTPVNKIAPSQRSRRRRPHFALLPLSARPPVCGQCAALTRDYRQKSGRTRRPHSSTQRTNPLLKKLRAREIDLTQIPRVRSARYRMSAFRGRADMTQASENLRF